MKKQKNSLLAFVLVFILVLQTSGISVTQAYFSDTAIVSGNTFTAGTLDLKLDSNFLGILNLDTPINLSVINQGNLPFEYKMMTNIVSGSDNNFCADLNIEVKKDSTTIFDNSLLGLNVTDQINSGQDDLIFIITDPSNNSVGKICNFSFHFKAWQPELDFSQGFTDKEITTAVVYSNGTNIPILSSGVVLNEFLPNPNGYEYGFDFGSDSSDMPQGEWIELYNNNDIDVDLTGWYIKDLADHKIEILSTNTQPSTTIIPAHGWLVIYMNSSILNNTSPETITLYNDIDNVQDSYSYDSATYCDMEPTPENNNDTNPSGDCNSVPGNKSYARIPDGIGAWIDPIPTPGTFNELVEDETIEKSLIVESTTNVTPAEEIPSEKLEKPVVEEKIITKKTEPEVKQETTTEEEIVKEQPIIEDEIIEENGEEIIAEEEKVVKEEITEEVVVEEQPIEKVVEEITLPEEVTPKEETPSAPVEVINNEEVSE